MNPYEIALLQLQAQESPAGYKGTMQPSHWRKPSKMGQALANAFQKYDPSNAQAQRQIGSSAAGVMMPNNPYRAEAERAVLANVSNAITGGESMMPMTGITTFHGSPTSGIKKFDLNFRGTGEGRLSPDSPLKESFKDMIAHGLYTAENQAIAKGYQERLASQVGGKLPGDDVSKWWSDLEQRFPNEPNKQAAWHLMNQMPDKQSALAYVESMPARMFNENGAFKYGEGGRVFTKDELAQYADDFYKSGSTYTAELLPHPDEYLHWDKPLGEQSGHVQNALNNMEWPWSVQKHVNEGVLVNGKPHEYWAITTPAGYTKGVFSTEAEANNAFKERTINFRGQDIHNAVAEMHGGDKKAADYLESLGIKGVKYLDGSSRSAGEGMHNYVTFRPEVESIITHENGQRIPGAVEEAYRQVRDPQSRILLEQQYPELKGLK